MIRLFELLALGVASLLMVRMEVYEMTTFHYVIALIVTVAVWVQIGQPHPTSDLVRRIKQDREEIRGIEG